MYSPVNAKRLLVTVMIGDRRFALPARTVERVLPMASLMPLPRATDCVIGLLNLQGTILPVVDPRPAVGVSRVDIRRDQQLVLVSAQCRYLLWVDQAEQLVEGQTEAYETAISDVRCRVIPEVAQLSDETIPVLSVDALYSSKNMQTGALSA